MRYVTPPCMIKLLFSLFGREFMDQVIFSCKHMHCDLCKANDFLLFDIIPFERYGNVRSKLIIIAQYCRQSLSRFFPSWNVVRAIRVGVTLPLYRDVNIFFHLTPSLSLHFHIFYFPFIRCYHISFQLFGTEFRFIYFPSCVCTSSAFSLIYRKNG